ncbi:MAG: family 43 glycosylhydrolase [Lachnospiraceae bacterium]|nr:family 43 glycosylhydrolase [Lachnospiraceae bacterium]
MKTQAFNPYLPSYEYIPDAEPRVFGDRVYIYGSHDRFNGKGFCELNYVCWSAPLDDLGSWRYEGEIYNKFQEPLCDGDHRALPAPDAIQGPDGRYYLYYAFDYFGVISVAVCDTPAGKYQFYGYVHHSDGTLLGRKEGDGTQFDPGIFVDDDGRVYLYSGFAPRRSFWEQLSLPVPAMSGGMVTELMPDMLTVKNGSRMLIPGVEDGSGTEFEGHEFFEASSMRKTGERYYLIYSSIKSHELCYAVSAYPDRDFSYGGTIVSNGDVGLDDRDEEEALNYTGNTHGSLVEINGQWYVFYHRQTNRHMYSRQGCAEKIRILADGSIPQVEMTSCGLNAGPLQGREKYEARIACNLLSREGSLQYAEGISVSEVHPYFTQDGEDRENHPDQHIANMTDGSIAGFKYFDLDFPARIGIRYRGKGTGAFCVSTDIGGVPLVRIEVNPAEAWTELWAEITAEVKGVYPLYIEYQGEGAVDLIGFEIQ